MPESHKRRPRLSKAIKEQMFLRSPISPFGRAVLAIWPDDAAKMLAYRCDISVRNANQIIRGERKVPARALVALMRELG